MGVPSQTSEKEKAGDQIKQRGKEKKYTKASAQLQGKTTCAIKQKSSENFGLTRFIM